MKIIEQPRNWANPYKEGRAVEGIVKILLNNQGREYYG